MADLAEMIMGEVAKNYNTAKIFNNNYKDMQDSNTKYADKYFHGLANCQAVQQGDLAGPLLFDLLKEAYDLSRKNHFDKNGDTYLNNVKDSIKDLYADYYGYAEGLSDFNGDCKKIMNKYRPRGLDIKY